MCIRGMTAYLLQFEGKNLRQVHHPDSSPLPSCTPSASPPPLLLPRGMTAYLLQFEGKNLRQVHPDSSPLPFPPPHLLLTTLTSAPSLLLSARPVRLLSSGPGRGNFYCPASPIPSAVHLLRGGAAGGARRRRGAAAGDAERGGATISRRPGLWPLELGNGRAALDSKGLPSIHPYVAAHSGRGRGRDLLFRGTCAGASLPGLRVILRSGRAPEGR